MKHVRISKGSLVQRTSFGRHDNQGGMAAVLNVDSNLLLILPRFQPQVRQVQLGLVL
jgi:hypothetical protein